jgi:MFS family permease
MDATQYLSRAICAWPMGVLKSVRQAEGAADMLRKARSDQTTDRSIFHDFQSTLFIGALNTTVVATAIPTICSDLNSAAGYSWIGASYVIAASACSPIWAKLSDIWGRKPILLMGVALYFASSIVCAVSTSMAMLIAGRALQGISGGGFMTLINIVVSDLFSMRFELVIPCIGCVLLKFAAGVEPSFWASFTQPGLLPAALAQYWAAPSRSSCRGGGSSGSTCQSVDRRSSC